MKSIVRNGFGELLETGKAAAQQAGKIPGQIAQAAGQQISGKKPTPQIPQVGEAKKGAIKPDIKPEEGIKDLLGKPLPPEKMAQLKQKDALGSNKNLDEVRSKLGVEKIKRYQELQQKIGQEEQKREEIRADEAGKTGYRTLEEKAEYMEEKRKKEVEAQVKDQGSLLPSSPSKTPGIGLQRKKTQTEVKLGKIG
jgi:hypothetical protein